MNLDQLQHKLIAAARTVKPSDCVPYAFEKRIMARLTEGARVDLLGAWSAALWRSAAGCVAVVALSSLVTLSISNNAPETDFSQEFETAVFASADSPSVDSVDEAW